MSEILSNLRDVSRTRIARKRKGRGYGSCLGKTSGRGEKGQGSRRGARRRWGYEGGQVRLYMKIPTRGFSRTPFQHHIDTVNLYQIETAYQAGEVVNIETLKQHGFASGRSNGIKILGDGELTKSLTFEVHAVSNTAREKILHSKGHLTIID